MIGWRAWREGLDFETRGGALETWSRGAVETGDDLAGSPTGPLAARLPALRQGLGTQKQPAAHHFSTPGSLGSTLSALSNHHRPYQKSKEPSFSKQIKLSRALSASSTDSNLDAAARRLFVRLVLTRPK